jgi:hypothetical protein
LVFSSLDNGEPEKVPGIIKNESRSRGRSGVIARHVGKKEAAFVLIFGFGVLGLKGSYAQKRRCPYVFSRETRTGF